MCQRFINDFVEKVIEKSKCCSSCDTRKKVCKNYNDEYIHLEIEHTTKGFYHLPKEIWGNVLITTLHTMKDIGMVNDFIDMLHRAITHKDVMKKLLNHVDCISLSQEYFVHYKPEAVWDLNFVVCVKRDERYLNTKHYCLIKDWLILFLNFILTK